ncbi:XRE family transcriptional regulator [Deinococcus alpinitundrae]|uniref:XRE family transcriptional regulator n=1 Tax=Deinococcus alpinitundrae TaxID=468913 RepID=UPI001379FE02|nr:S24 family peptidase [Deinococcus alpinitundrae]
MPGLRPAALPSRRHVIKELRLATGLSVAQLAAHLGVDRSYVRKLELGTVDPLNVTGPRFVTLAAAVNLTPVGLLRALGQPGPVERAEQQDHAEFQATRVLTSLGYANAGPVNDPTSTPHVTVPAWFSGNLRYVLVEGESMRHPTKRGIQDGDTVLINVAELEPVDSKIFVIQSPHYGICVKRLRLLSECWWAFSDNPDFPPFPLDDTAAIIGRYKGVLDIHSDE